MFLCLLSFQGLRREGCHVADFLSHSRHSDVLLSCLAASVFLSQKMLRRTCPRSRGSKATARNMQDSEPKLTEAGRFLKKTAEESIQQALGFWAATVTSDCSAVIFGHETCGILLWNLCKVTVTKRSMQERIPKTRRGKRREDRGDDPLLDF